VRASFRRIYVRVPDRGTTHLLCRPCVVLARLDISSVIGYSFTHRRGYALPLAGIVSARLLPSRAEDRKAGPFSVYTARRQQNFPAHFVRQKKTYPNQLSPDLGDRLVGGKRDVRHVGRVADDARVRVAVDVGLPLPARRVRVACSDELGLEPLEFLLGAEFVGLDTVSTRGKNGEL
jgi:hypothetical protein